MKQKTYDRVEGKYLPEKVLFDHQHPNHCRQSFCFVPGVPSLKIYSNYYVIIVIYIIVYMSYIYIYIYIYNADLHLFL